MLPFGNMLKLHILREFLKVAHVLLADNADAEYVTHLEAEFVVVLVESDIHEAAAEAVVGEDEKNVLENLVNVSQILSTSHRSIIATDQKRTSSTNFIRHKIGRSQMVISNNASDKVTTQLLNQNQSQ